MRSSFAIVLAGSLLALPAQAATELVTYEGSWGDAISTVLESTDIPGGVEIIRYDGRLAVLADSEPALIDVETGAANVICDEGPARPMPPVFWETNGRRDALLNGAAHDCAAGYLVTSLVLASREGGPEDWASFFEADEDAAPRALPRGPRGTLEIALMAAGTAHENVYAALASEEGQARAFDALSALDATGKLVFWKSLADAAALLESGEIAAAALPSTMIAENMPYAPHFGGQVYRIQHMALLAGEGAPQDAALDVVAHLLDPKMQARLAGLTNAGPVSREAWMHVPEDLAARLPSAPAHKIEETGLREDADFWARHGDELTDRFAAWLAGRGAAR